jgi:hypothetical protein
MTERRYRVKPDVLAAKLQGETVLLHLGTKDYHRLNETASVAWSTLEKSGDPAAATQALLDQFEIDFAHADAAVNGLIQDLLERGLLEQAP